MTVGRDAVRAAAATVVAYGGLLAWDRERDRHPVTGELTGPYQPWQVVALVVVLLAVAVWAVSRPDAGAVWAVPTALTVCFAVDGYVDGIVRGSDGLWALGALLVASGSSAVAGLLVLVSRLVQRVGRGSAPPAARRAPDS